ncbi:uncharacterized protein G2W53_013705 [Senna tora]|uniref:Uncharacterized protein n=1 Tax=Senna tora TaxID=362788 RepID=A0A834U107_9FABA|nr:uncharacterized protein G2W53_013705 [Senna tora]
MIKRLAEAVEIDLLKEEDLLQYHDVNFCSVYPITNAQTLTNAESSFQAQWSTRRRLEKRKQSLVHSDNLSNSSCCILDSSDKQEPFIHIIAGNSTWKGACIRKRPSAAASASIATKVIVIEQRSRPQISPTILIRSSSSSNPSAISASETPSSLPDKAISVLFKCESWVLEQLSKEENRVNKTCGSGSIA